MHSKLIFYLLLVQIDFCRVKAVSFCAFLATNSQLTYCREYFVKGQWQEMDFAPFPP
jgi:hypothetical protein